MKKNVLTLIIVFLIAFLYSPNAYSRENGEHECTKCHKIPNGEIKSILKEGVPDAKIIEVRPSPVKGLYEVAFEAKGRKEILYIDYSKEFLISGAIYKVKTKANLTGERIYALNKVDISKVPLDEAILMGDKDAAKKVIVFTDPD